VRPTPETAGEEEPWRHCDLPGFGAALTQGGEAARPCPFTKAEPTRPRKPGGSGPCRICGKGPTRTERPRRTRRISPRPTLSAATASRMRGKEDQRAEHARRSGIGLSAKEKDRKFEGWACRDRRVRRPHGLALQSSDTVGDSHARFVPLVFSCGRAG
jgi:hypothetical protein